MSRTSADARPALRRGLSRQEAAEYLGVSASKFDEFIGLGVIPGPRITAGARVWDIHELNFNNDLSPAKVGSVYVVGFDQYVKIGFSSRVGVRIAQIQQGLPVPLTIYATIGSQTRRNELDLHAQFAAHRSLGEWFIKSGELAEWIEELAAFPEGGAS